MRDGRLPPDHPVILVIHGALDWIETRGPLLRLLCFLALGVAVVAAVIGSAMAFLAVIGLPFILFGTPGGPWSSLAYFSWMVGVPLGLYLFGVTGLDRG